MIIRSEPTVRVALVKPALAPYRITLLNRLSRIPGVCLDVLVCYDRTDFLGHAIDLDGALFEYRALDTWSFGLPFQKRLVPFPVSPGLVFELGRKDYDVVIAFGWTMPNTLLALLHSKWLRRPVLLWETSTPHPPSRLKQWLMPFIRLYFRAFDGAFAASSLCKDYLVSMGARADRIGVLPQVIDNAYFMREAERARERRDEIRAGLGISTRHVILYTGRFVEGKGLGELIDAFAKIALTRDDVTLLYVGAGHLKGELVQQTEALGMEGRVIFHPAVHPDELPPIYASADVFVLNSRHDTFGVVVAEAMACGLPIIATPDVGAVKDLVHDKVNGLVVPYGNETELQVALLTLLDNDELREEMGQHSRRIISRWNLDLAANNFCTLIEGVMSRELCAQSEPHF